MKTDRLLGAAAIAAAAAMAAAAQAYAAPIAYEPVGPRAFPLMLAAVLAAVGGGLVLWPSAHAAAVAPGRAAALAGCVAAIVGYALLFQLLGFVIATIVMALPVGLAFGGGWRVSLAGGAGLGLGLYLLFDKLLDVVLPTGPLVFGR